MIRIALVLVLSAWVMSPAAADSGWVSTEWLATCTPATVDAGVPWVACDGNSKGGPAAITVAQLELASIWLKSLQFYGPEITIGRDIDGQKRYLVWIDDESPGEKLNSESWGYYDPGAQSLNVNSGYYFGMGTSDAELAKDTYHIGAPIHELFHAVQAAYGYPLDPARAWITEGMAQAVMLAWLRLQGVSVAPKTRHYDLPLPEPLCGRVGNDTHYGCYATQQFWTWVGQRIGSAGAVQYLHALLQQDLGPDRGLRGIDTGLRQFEPEGMYELYPAFIAEVAGDEAFFSQVAEITLTYDADRKVEQFADGAVRAVAANAHRVVINLPAGETANLEIGLAGPAKNLHLIVNDQRMDTRSGSRKPFRATLQGQAQAQTFFVRVANVAVDAADTEAQDYRLNVRLTPRAACTFRAEVTYPDGTTKTYEGMAGINDRHHTLSLHKDAANVSDEWYFGVDIAPLELGDGPGSVTTRGRMSAHSPKNGPFHVVLNIERNADPGNVAGWDDMTPQETLDSGLGFPDRLAMRRLDGSFVAVNATDWGTVRVEAEFDAGNQVYLCEGGLEMQKNAFKKMMQIMMERLD